MSRLTRRAFLAGSGAALLAGAGGALGGCAASAKGDFMPKKALMRTIPDDAGADLAAFYSSLR